MEKGLNGINKCCSLLSRFDDLMRSKFPLTFFEHGKNSLGAQNLKFFGNFIENIFKKLG